MTSLESDKINALWQNESLTFPFYQTFSNCIINFTMFLIQWLAYDVFDSMISLESEKGLPCDQMNV